MSEQEQSFELKENPKTGQLERVPVNAVRPEGMQRALSPDDIGESDSFGYSSTVELAGVTFYIRELTDEQYAQVEKREVELAEWNTKMSQGDGEAGKQFTAGMIGFYDYVIECAVVNWSKPKAFSKAVLKGFYPSVKAELSTLILQKSRLGIDESRFLAQRS